MKVKVGSELDKLKSYGVNILDMGDLYLVDEGGLGASVMAKGIKRAEDKKLCFFNVKGCKALAKFLTKKMGRSK